VNEAGADNSSVLAGQGNSANAFASAVLSGKSRQVFTSGGGVAGPTEFGP
jgi:hypothetical protein